MSQNPLIPLILLVCMSSTVFSSFNIATPTGLKDWWDKNSDATHTSIASFGEIPWGRKIMGRLGLASPLTACSPIELDEQADFVPTILVAKRGECPFYLKAHYAQLAGAKLLLIVDTEYEEVELKLMVESAGQGGNIHIASALLARKGGDRIIESLSNPNPEINRIVGTFDFTLPKGDNVNYNLWLSSSSAQTFKFLRDWKSYYDTLSSTATMTPHFGHFKLYEVENIDNCVCEGRYCATDPDGELPNTGRDVILENLRQLCIIQEYDMNAWWRYALEYKEACLSGGDMADCSRNTQSRISIDSDEIDWCVRRSFDNANYEKCTKNRLLDIEEDALYADNAHLLPSVVINGFTYRGNLVPARGVFEAVCESFNTMPSVCDLHFEEVGTANAPDIKTSHAPIVLTALVFLLVFSFFVFCCYRRYLARAMYKQGIREVNMAVSQYISLKDDESNNREM